MPISTALNNDNDGDRIERRLGPLPRDNAPDLVARLASKCGRQPRGVLAASTGTMVGGEGNTIVPYGKVMMATANRAEVYCVVTTER